MTDYKELCENPQAGWGYVDELRDAIKQLVKERDAVIDDLRLVANNCHEDYVFSACFCCKRNDTCNGQPSTGCEFEWRGCVDGDNC